MVIMPIKKTDDPVSHLLEFEGITTIMKEFANHFLTVDAKETATIMIIRKNAKCSA